MFHKNNGNHQQSKSFTSREAVPDLSEFDQDLEIYPTNETGYEDSPSPADSSIPSFGIAKASGKANRISPRTTVAQPINPGQNGKKKQPLEGSDKKKSSKPKRVPTKQDNRWRFLFGLGLFVVGLAGSILLVQSNTKGIEVIVVTRDISPGQPITSADLATARMSVPPDFAALLVSSREINVLTENVEGSKPSTKVAARKLRVHQPIMQGDIVSPNTLNKTGVPDGMVAMALPVSASTAVARITPGDTVNLLFVNNRGSGVGNASPNETGGAAKGSLETTLLAERVVVLDVVRSGSSVSLGSAGNSGSSTGDNLSSSGSRATITNLTLLLTPEQAQKLAVAKEAGTVNVVLLPFQVQLEKTDNKQGQGEVGANTPTGMMPSPIATIQPTAPATSKP